MGMKRTRELADRIEENANELRDLEGLPELIGQLGRDWEQSKIELSD